MRGGCIRRLFVILNVMNNWPSHVTKTRHLASRQTGHVCVVRIIQTSKRLTKTDSRRPLFASKTGRSSHTISIQSALGLRRFRLWAGFLHWTSTELELHNWFFFHVGMCVKARPIKLKRGYSPWRIFRGGGEAICNDEYTSKHSTNVEKFRECFYISALVKCPSCFITM